MNKDGDKTISHSIQFCTCLAYVVQNKVQCGKPAAEYFFNKVYE